MNDDDVPNFPMPTLEEAEEIIQSLYGMSSAELEAMPFSDRVKLMMANGGDWACSPNIAPKDSQGNPITSGKAASKTRH